VVELSGNQFERGRLALRSLEALNILCVRLGRVLRRKRIISGVVESCVADWNCAHGKFAVVNPDVPKWMRKKARYQPLGLSFQERTIMRSWTTTTQNVYEMMIARVDRQVLGGLNAGQNLRRKVLCGFGFQIPSPLCDKQVCLIAECSYPKNFRKSFDDPFSKPGKTGVRLLFPRWFATASLSTWRKSVVTARSRPS
jgi:hypothetical protein